VRGKAYLEIEDAQKVLANEINRYNYKRIHSTTGEVPYFRFKNAIINKTSLFNPTFGLYP